MFDMVKQDLEDAEFMPESIICELYAFGRLLQSFVMSVSVLSLLSTDSVLKSLARIFTRKKEVDLPTDTDPLFQLVEAVKYMRFWLWAAEKSIEVHGKDAPPELLEFYEADRREYDRLTNPEQQKE